MAAKEKKRRKKIEAALLKKRILHGKIMKEQNQFIALEKKERKLDPSAREVQEKIDQEMGQKRLSPKPNKPCLCESGKKFKICCGPRVKSGEIEIITSGNSKPEIREVSNSQKKTEKTEKKEVTTAE